MCGSLNRTLKGQRRRKCELPESIETGSKTKISGQYTAKSATGSIPRKKTDPRPPTLRINREAKTTNKMSLLLFCSLLIFASSNINQSKSIAIGSHNLHGYPNRAAYHKSCIDTHGGIWLAQELWLSEQQLTQLDYLNAQYVARSGMEDAVSAGVLKGRPFGGVSVSWSQDLNHIVTPLSNYRHKRLIAVELKLAYQPMRKKG